MFCYFCSVNTGWFFQKTYEIITAYTLCLYIRCIRRGYEDEEGGWKRGKVFFVMHQHEVNIADNICFGIQSQKYIVLSYPRGGRSTLYFWHMDSCFSILACLERWNVGKCAWIIEVYYAFYHDVNIFFLYCLDIHFKYKECSHLLEWLLMSSFTQSTGDNTSYLVLKICLCLSIAVIFSRIVFFSWAYRSVQ